MAPPDPTPPASRASDLRCSLFARSEDLDPVGTAGSYEGIVAVEMPLPWPSDLARHPALVEVAPALEAANVRLQGLVPPSRGVSETRRLLWFARPRGAFDRYDGRAWSAPDARVAEAVAALVASGGTSAGPAEPHGAPGAAGTAGVGRHVLVCTHGRRDACWGALGTRLALALPGLGAGVHVWRTSHTGGHRFAPTALLLPEGTMWAYLDLDRLVGISDRTLDIGEAARLYRGCTGLRGPEVQAADRAALRSVGWGWLDHRRRGQVLASSDGCSRVRLDAQPPEGQPLAFVATVETVRLVPVPDCGRPPHEAQKSAPELRVRDFRAA